MRAILAVFGLLTFSQLGCAPGQPASTDIVAFPGSEPATKELSAGYTLDTPIEVIVADPRGEAVLNKNIPKLLMNPNYPMFKGMSLKTIAMFARGQLNDEKLAQVKADLGALSTAEK